MALMPIPPRKILILTSSMGFGHRSAARALADALQALEGRAVEVSIADPFDQPTTPLLLKGREESYDRIVRQWPELYKLGFEIADEPLPEVLIDSALSVLLFTTIQELLKQRQPDLVMVTFPQFLPPLQAVMRITETHIPIVTVITDLVSIHGSWFHHASDLLVTPTETAEKLAYQHGLKREKVVRIGIPVSPALAAETRSKAELRRLLGWEIEPITLLAVGSSRVSGLAPVLKLINHSGHPVQIIAVAGKDQPLYDELQGMEWHIPAQVIFYADNMSELLHAADALICKAGGLIVSEALACGLPLMLVDIIPGQEEGNADFVLQGAAGDLVDDSPIEALEILCHWLLNEGALLRERAANAAALGHPTAAAEIAALAYDLALKGRSRETTEQRLMAELRGLLDRFEIPWREQGGLSGISFPWMRDD